MHKYVYVILRALSGGPRLLYQFATKRHLLNKNKQGLVAHSLNQDI